MQVIAWKQFLENGLQTGNASASVTVGVFDGVHRGHRALLERVVSHNAYVPAVITFKENHKTADSGHKNGSERRITREIFSFEERLKLFEKLGIQIVIVIDFNDEFKHMRGIEFLELLLKCCKIGFFAAGADFRCGYQLDTDAEAIRGFFSSRGIPAEIVPQVMEDSLPISSSRIRKAIFSGDLTLAEKMLGAAYSEARAKN